ncbi:MAG TPA: GNAT family N-acetyltransferase [Gaiellaceae bacterium]|jgi:GNAT superfamily N-acetyltransferase
MNVRAYTPNDADAVAALARADEELYYGHRSHVQAEDVTEWLSRSNESWLFEDDGKLVAAGWSGVWGETGLVVGVVADKGKGIGSEILTRAEAFLADQEIAKTHAIAQEPDEEARALFEARGYAEVRRFYDMAIALDGEPPAPVVPDGLLLDDFHLEEARAFQATLNEAFQDHWDWHGLPYDEWWELRKNDDHSLWFVVRDGDEIAAAVRNEANRHGGGYVAIIGVRRAWRGRGLAKALLHRSFGEFWRRGIARVTLGVDAESPTGATHLYEGVGMSVESATIVFEKRR